MSNLTHIGETVQSELNDLFVGPLIGRGAYREVYEHALDPSLVIKIENGTEREFCNVSEWTIWKEFEYDPKLSIWLAPCVAISFSGSVLVQRRTQPISRLPAKIPNVFADTKAENWGRYKGKPVMHDYGNHSFFTNARRGLRLKERDVTAGM